MQARPIENCSCPMSNEQLQKPSSPTSFNCVVRKIAHKQQQDHVHRKPTLLAYVDRLFCGFLQRLFPIYQSSPPHAQTAIVLATTPRAEAAKAIATASKNTIDESATTQNSMQNNTTAAASAASGTAAAAIAAPTAAAMASGGGSAVTHTNIDPSSLAAPMTTTVAAAPGGAVEDAAAFHPFQMIPPKINRQAKQTPITDDFEISTTVLGQGINGKVVQCTNRKTGHLYALKVLNDNNKARREVDLHWRASGCRHIVQIVAVYENTYGEHKCLLVVMEW